jgi:hypothetical protein
MSLPIASSSSRDRVSSSSWRPPLTASPVDGGGSSSNPSRYIDIASSTLIPPSISEESGVKSIVELDLVRTLLLSVLLVNNVLELDVKAECKLDLSWSSLESSGG